MTEKVRNNSMPSYEIREKYYPVISEQDFNQIISADTISSNPQKNKVGKYAKWLLMSRLMIWKP